MRTIVVTGGIGSGKSVLCGYLSANGIPVYDSDTRTKTLYDTDPQLLERIEQLAGTDIKTAEGLLDRRKLASLLFADPQLMASVEAIVHPRVLDDFDRWRHALQPTVPYLVFESAIFYLKPLFHSIADKVILVDADLETRISRVMSRDHCTREKVIDRINSQKYPDDIRPDVILQNNGSKEQLIQAFKKTINNL